MKRYIPEGHTIVVEAPQRRGKTLACVIFAYWAYKRGRRVFSTIDLGFPYEPLTFNELDLSQSVERSKRFHNSFILIDELNFFFDCRASASSQNRRFGAFLLQQKKQGAHIMGTTHGLSYLDLRLRDNHDFIATPTTIPAHPDAPVVLELVMENGPTMPAFKKTIRAKCAPFLGLYDTTNIFDPFGALADQKPRKRDPGF
jgi:hypothetical protein